MHHVKESNRECGEDANLCLTVTDYCSVSLNGHATPAAISRKIRHELNVSCTLPLSLPAAQQQSPQECKHL